MLNHVSKSKELLLEWELSDLTCNHLWMKENIYNSIDIIDKKIHMQYKISI